MVIPEDGLGANSASLGSCKQASTGPRGNKPGCVVLRLCVVPVVSTAVFVEFGVYEVDVTANYSSNAKVLMSVLADPCPSTPLVCIPEVLNVHTYDEQTPL